MAPDTEPTTRAPIERTEHPHVVKSADTLGGEPRVEATRIPVRQIFNMIVGGVPAAEIVEDFPPLTLAQVYDAVSYASDHSDEMAFYEEKHKLRTILPKNDMVYVAGRLIFRDRLRPEDVSPGVEVYTWETLPEELER